MLYGRKIVVLGGASGIGFVAARAAATAGAEIAIQSNRATELASAERRFGGPISTIMGDLSALDGPAQIVAEAADKLGGLDGLILSWPEPEADAFEAATPEAIEATAALAMRAPILLLQSALPHFDARPGGGSVLVLAPPRTGAALLRSAGAGARDATIAALAQSLARRAVRINHLTFDPEGQADAAAPHVVFWLSDRSAPATGQTSALISACASSASDADPVRS